MNAIDEPKAYIDACIKGKSNLNIGEACYLMEIYPEHQEYIFSLLNKENLADYVLNGYTADGLEKILEFCAKENILSEENLKSLADSMISFRENNKAYLGDYNIEKYEVLKKSTLLNGYLIKVNEKNVNLCHFLNKIDEINKKIIVPDKAILMKSEDSENEEDEEQKEEKDNEGDKEVRVGESEEVDNRIIGSKFPLFNIKYDAEANELYLIPGYCSMDDGYRDYDLSQYESEINEFFAKMDLPVKFENLEVRQVGSDDTAPNHYVFSTDQMAQLLHLKEENLHRSTPIVHNYSSTQQKEKEIVQEKSKLNVESEITSTISAERKQR
jgi:hypothetical protein